MSLVFLSYARPDMPVAQRIASALIASGYEVWWDEQLPAHRTFYDVIEERLRSAHAVVVLWSRDALQSQWVRAEADLARTLDTLVQATVDGAMPPLPFNQVQCAQLADWTGQAEHREWRRVLESVGALAKGNTAPRAPAPPRIARRRVFTSRERAFAALAAVALLGVAALAYIAWDHLDGTAQTTTPASPTFVATTSSGTRYQRLTQAVGIEERPAASPDGKMVAYAATANGRSTIWVQMIAGGAPLEVGMGTHPRWLPDSSALVYFVAAESGETGELWEVAALGGAPRRLTIASGGADVSHDGARLAVVRNRGEENDLVVFIRDGAAPELTHTLPTASSYSTPRWSPDDRTIALIANEGGFSNVISLVDVGHGKASTIAQASFIEGQSWLPDGSGIVYASSTGSAPVYPPSFHLRRVDASGAHDRPLTIGDVSYVDPDIAKSGVLVASRVSMRSDIWNFPFGDLPTENTANGVRMTRQTGQVRTPSMSPDARHVAYLSDTGGHANVWVSQVDGTAARQVTFEHDPDVVIGLPLWSPSGDQIVFVRRDEQGSGTPGLRVAERRAEQRPAGRGPARGSARAPAGAGTTRCCGGRARRSSERRSPSRRSPAARR